MKRFATVFALAILSVSGLSAAPAQELARVSGLTPAFALQAYEARAARQSSDLASYSSTTVIHAQLPNSSQSAEFELQRYYAAPRTLKFKAVRFIGDNFVKSNIIVRVLQSEVDHVEKDDGSRTALNRANYKFTYETTAQINSRSVLVYEVKPRHKRSGLFKGRVALDASTGSLVQVSGSVVKSPSIFIRRIDFVQDYSDIGPFTFAVHIHSEALTRLVGPAIVDIQQRDYETVVNPGNPAPAGL